MPFGTPQLSTAWHTATDRRRRLVLLGLAIGLSALFTVLVLLFHVLSAIALLTWIVCAAIAWRPWKGPAHEVHMCVRTGVKKRDRHANDEERGARKGEGEMVKKETARLIAVRAKRRNRRSDD